MWLKRYQPNPTSKFSAEKLSSLIERRDKAHAAEVNPSSEPKSVNDLQRDFNNDLKKAILDATTLMALWQLREEIPHLTKKHRLWIQERVRVLEAAIKKEADLAESQRAQEGGVFA